LPERNHILITGATSGIGLGLLKAYYSMGWQVTAINRRVDAALEAQFPNVRFHHFDVRDLQAVERYFDEAARLNELPSLYFLSAGINKVDNVGDFSLQIFREVLEVNLMGVLNFVSVALRHAADEKMMFVCTSSTTNFFPNPNCTGYYVSKLALYQLFKRLDKLHRDQGTRFKTLVLGPISTNIFISGKLASKLQSKVRDLITVSVEEAVPPIVRFISSGRRTFFYPKLSCALFVLLMIVQSLYPGFYKGSAPPHRAPSP